MIDDSTTSSLNIRLLGNVSIYYRDERLDNKLSNKAMFIIILLLMSERNQMNKQRLTSLLWPDSDEEASKYNLRYNLWNLKKLIPAYKGTETFILSDKSTIYINPNYEYFADINELKEFDCKNDFSLDELENLSNLLKGDFIEGVSLKGSPEVLDLILIERMSCQNKQNKIMNKLYKKYDEISDHNSCILTLHEMLIADPFNEEIASNIINHLSKQGQYAKAKIFYKDFVSNLRSDLNIAPSKELKSLIKNVTESKTIESVDPISKPVKRQNREMVIDTFCISNIDYFWMSECINELFKSVDTETLEKINPSIFPYLMHVAPGISKYNLDMAYTVDSINDNILHIQVINALYELLEVIAGYYSLAIYIKDSDNIDQISQSFLSMLDNKPICNVSIQSN